jgi:glycosyltransferase involved in cell wall biosynthesis
MRKKRIFYLELSTAGTIGGSHHSLYFLVRELDRARYEPIVGFYEHNEFENEFRELGADVRILQPPNGFFGPRPFTGRLAVLNPLRRAFNSAANFISAVFLPMLRHARWLKANRVDLVHLNNHAFSGDWILACRLLGIPCVAHARGMRVKLDRFPLYIAKKLDRVFCISQAVCDSLVRCGCESDNFLLLHNGIDPEKLKVRRAADEIRSDLGISPSQPVIGMVGNIKRWKGQRVLVEALPAIIAKNPQLVCVFVGAVDGEDQPYFAEIEVFINEHGLSESVTFAGYTRNVPDYINIMDLVVHASIEPEPFGRVIIEAMAMGKPVVASGDGGVPEIVDEPACGLTFRPGSAEGLANSVNELLSNRPGLEAIGLSGLERVNSHFHIRTNAARTMEVYETLLAKPA